MMLNYRTAGTQARGAKLGRVTALLIHLTGLLLLTALTAAGQNTTFEIQGCNAPNDSAKVEAERNLTAAGVPPGGALPGPAERL